MWIYLEMIVMNMEFENNSNEVGVSVQMPARQLNGFVLYTFSFFSSKMFHPR